MTNSAISDLLISESQDPYFNLAYEYELLNRASLEGRHFLFFYRNRPCVVLGRFQNPWREVNFEKLPVGIEIVRRHSGGGTVYHDEGNWNFSIIRPGVVIDEKTNLDILVQALAHFSFTIKINDRYDLTFDQKKVSGSAFRRVKGATLHHGTLLINAKLDALRGSLGQMSGLEIEGKGVLSVSSSVINLGQYNSSLNWDSFIDQLENQLAVSRTYWGKDSLSAFVKKKAQELKSWEWRWGQGPKCMIEVSQGDQSISLSLEKGIVTKVSGSPIIAKALMNKQVKAGHLLTTELSDQTALVKKINIAFF
jgi:lipoate-protein ligase A